MGLLDRAEFEEINGEFFKGKATDVSVIVNSYNFSDYIRDTFDGILLQKTDYSVEVLIYDDASTDDSSRIIREYCNNYPTLFHGFLGNNNIYGTLSYEESAEFEIEWMRLYSHGKYLAYCEGDDYWIDENKLQIQVSYMEQHQDCLLTMHEALLKDFHDNSERIMKGDEPEHDIVPRELILQKTGIWPTASMVFTRDVALCPAWLNACGVSDWPRQLYAITRGSVHFFDKCMSVYRYKHAGSWSKEVSSGLSKSMPHRMLMLQFLMLFNDYTDGRYNDVIVERAGRFYMDLMWNVPNVEFLLEAMNGVNYCISGKDGHVKDKLLDLFRTINDPLWLPEDVISFLNQHKEIYIMGAGRLSGLLGEKLKKNNHVICGYVISDDESKADGVIDVEYLSEVDWDDEQKGIIVAIGHQYYTEVKSSLDKYKVDKIFPFVISGR